MRAKEGGKEKTGLALRHQSLACHTRFALASVRKTKRLRRKQTLEVVKEMTYGGILARDLKKGVLTLVPGVAPVSVHSVPYLGTVQGSKCEHDLSLSSYPSLPSSSNASYIRSPR